MYAIGKNILQYLASYKIRRWWGAAITDLKEQLIHSMQVKNEVTAGGILTAGTLSDVAMGGVISQLSGFLNGRLRLPTALADTDLLIAGGVVGQPLFEDGGDATSFVTLVNGEAVRGTLIVTNSDGAGAAVESDNGAVKFIAVFKGTTEATAKAATTFPTSVDIQAALDASTGVHDGVTGWAHLADFVFARAGGVSTLTITLNRNNVVQAR